MARSNSAVMATMLMMTAIITNMVLLFRENKKIAGVFRSKMSS